MKVRKLEIKNFRGIKELSWIIPDEKMICLIGSGDIGKTTILEALNWLLSDKWSISIKLTDFNNTEEPIQIKAFITDIPEQLGEFNNLGTFEFGFSQSGGLNEAPIDGYEPCVCISLVIDDSLEPSWKVSNEVVGKQEKINSAQRRQLGVFKIDGREDVHFRWNRTSALFQYANKEGESASIGKIVQAAAAEAIDRMDLSEDMKRVFKTVKECASGFGALDLESLHLGIDETIAGSHEPLSLYSCNIPLSAFGLGTKRVTSMAIQNLSSSDKTTYLIDEIETGLEPHRITALLQMFENDDNISQVFMTSHSNIVVEFCSFKNLFVVTKNGETKQVLSMPQEFEELHRSNPSAFLARRILVVEGKTEEGLLKALIAKWDENNRAEKRPIAASCGSVVCQGDGGDKTCKKAKKFKTLGYEVAVLVDSDVAEDRKNADSLKDQGVKVYRWDDNQCLETALIASLKKEQCIDMVSWVIENGMCDEPIVMQVFKNHFSCHDDCRNFSEITWDSYDENQVREFISDACLNKNSKNKGWFKSVPYGELLGEWILNLLAKNEIQESPFWDKIEEIKTFLYRN